MTLETGSISLLEEALVTLGKRFDDLPMHRPAVDLEAWAEVLNTVAERMQDNYPYPHPLYAGQMLKPPHPIARAAYMLAMWMNPNNHALDGGRASSFMEKEAVADLAAMFGWSTHLGHLTSGGTMANLEGLWVAGRLNPGKKVVASQQAHYTHGRISGVLQLPFAAIPVDSSGRMNLAALETLLKAGDVGTVVVTMGTTAVGSVDPLLDVLKLREQHGFRIHADAAYGGYFGLVDNLHQDTQAAFAALDQVDSLAIDPHKHGLQPYGCGCILFQDPSVGQYYKHDSPYTYFTSGDLHLGEITLECSRAGASAVALWATHQLLPPIRGGTFGQDLSRCRQAALDLYARLQADDRFHVAFPPELDIVVWAPKGDSVEAISAQSQAIFDECERNELHLAVSKLPAAFFPDIDTNEGVVVALRSCLMKPEHLDWIDTIWSILSMAAVS